MANNKRLNPQATRVLDQMKQEIASEFGVALGAETPSRLNGAVGGEMTKRLIALAESALSRK